MKNFQHSTNTQHCISQHINPTTMNKKEATQILNRLSKLEGKLSAAQSAPNASRRDYTRANRKELLTAVTFEPEVRRNRLDSFGFKGLQIREQLMNHERFFVRKFAVIYVPGFDRTDGRVRFCLDLDPDDKVLSDGAEINRQPLSQTCKVNKRGRIQFTNAKVPSGEWLKEALYGAPSLGGREDSIGNLEWIVEEFMTTAGAAGTPGDAVGEFWIDYDIELWNETSNAFEITRTDFADEVLTVGTANRLAPIASNATGQAVNHGVLSTAGAHPTSTVFQATYSGSTGAAKISLADGTEVPAGTDIQFATIEGSYNEGTNLFTYTTTSSVIGIIALGANLAYMGMRAYRLYWMGNVGDTILLENVRRRQLNPT